MPTFSISVTKPVSELVYDVLKACQQANEIGGQDGAMLADICDLCPKYDEFEVAEALNDLVNMKAIGRMQDPNFKAERTIYPARDDLVLNIDE